MAEVWVGLGGACSDGEVVEVRERMAQVGHVVGPITVAGRALGETFEPLPPLLLVGLGALGNGFDVGVVEEQPSEADLSLRLELEGAAETSRVERSLCLRMVDRLVN